MLDVAAFNAREESHEYQRRLSDDSGSGLHSAGTRPRSAVGLAAECVGAAPDAIPAIAGGRGGFGRETWHPAIPRPARQDAAHGTHGRPDAKPRGVWGAHGSVKRRAAAGEHGLRVLQAHEVAVERVRGARGCLRQRAPRPFAGRALRAQLFGAARRSPYRAGPPQNVASERRLYVRRPRPARPHHVPQNVLQDDMRTRSVKTVALAVRDPEALQHCKDLRAT